MNFRCSNKFHQPSRKVDLEEVNTSNKNVWYVLNWFFYILEKKTHELWRTFDCLVTLRTLLAGLKLFFHHHSQTNSLKSSSKSWNMSCHSLMIESELDQVILPLRQTINGDCSWPLKKMASWKCLKGIKHLAIVHETAGNSGYPSPNGSCWCIFAIFADTQKRFDICWVYPSCSL